jgi:hypothetical protein
MYSEDPEDESESHCAHLLLQLKGTSQSVTLHSWGRTKREAYTRAMNHLENLATTVTEDIKKEIEKKELNNANTRPGTET